jgi:Flp pilus assembly CpaF family ATPase
MVSSAIGFVIHMKRQRPGARVIAEVAHLNGDVGGSTMRVNYLHH